MIHSELLNLLVDFIIKQYENELCELHTDHSCTESSRPQSIERCIPDVYAITINHICIIGEAKTPDDFETNMSEVQIKTFLRYLHGINGIFFLSIPFLHHRKAMSRIRYFVQDESLCVKCYIIHEFGSRELLLL